MQTPKVGEKIVKTVLKLVEMRTAITHHVRAMRAVLKFLEAGNTSAAISRLDLATTALESSLRGIEVDETLNCEQCGEKQSILAWADDGCCRECGFEFPKGKDETT